MRITHPFLLSCAMLLSACSSFNQEKLKPSLGDIKTIQPAIEYSSANISEVDLIKSYKELLKIAKKENQDDGATLKRLSDISLEHSIDDLLSEDELIIKRGKILSNEAILGYNDYLKQFPNKPNNDEILYQLAKVYDINGDLKNAFKTLLILDKKYPNSKYISETKFRIAESYFSNGVYPEAKEYYKNIIDHHADTKFYRNSLYKYAWSLIKNNDNEASVYAFLKLVDLYYQDGSITETTIAQTTSDSEKTLIYDVLRAINLSINYDLEKVKINHYFKQNKKPYEPLIYESLALYLNNKNRVNDAASIYFSYLEDNEPSYVSFKLFNKGVTLLKPTPFTELYLKSKKAIVTIYSKPSLFKKFNLQQKTLTRPILARHDYELATYYHALAQTPSKKRLSKSHFQLAEKWYSLFLKRFSGSPRYGEVSFLLAETFTERQLYLQAAKHYRFSSYQIKKHKKSQEAGYATILSYQNALAQQHKDDEKYHIEQQLIQSSIDYHASYPADKRSDDIIYNASSRLYDDKRYDDTLAILLPLIDSQSTSQKLLQKVTELTAHSFFNQQHYLKANIYYVVALKSTSLSQQNKQDLNSKLAESYYQLANQAKDNNQHTKAARLYLKANKISPVTQVRKIALYDAANQYLVAKDWESSISLLKRFKNQYKNDKKLYRGAQEKMALAYRSAGNTQQAALAVLALANNSSPKLKQALLWEAATLFYKDGNTTQYLKTYDDYARLYPLPLERSLKARLVIADYNLTKNNIVARKSWLKSIVNNEHKYTKNSNQDANKIAANASLNLAQYALQDYKSINLSVPLKKSLTKKKKALKVTIKQFSNTLKYADPKTQTLATYGLGEIYRDFASSLLKSERPKNLNDDEQEEYGYLLEDQAFPFEEKAIKIHKRNFSNTQKGLYNEGIKLSHQSLRTLLPFQYDKKEISTPYVAP